VAVLGSDRWCGKLPSQPVRGMQWPPGQVEDPLRISEKIT
jgi:hypothetical protein